MRPEERRREEVEGRGEEEGDFKEATLLVLKMEKEVTCFKMPAASRCWKRQASSGFQSQSLQRNGYPNQHQQETSIASLQTPLILVSGYPVGSR